MQAITVKPEGFAFRGGESFRNWRSHAVWRYVLIRERLLSWRADVVRS